MRSLLGGKVNFLTILPRGIGSFLLGVVLRTRSTERSEGRKQGMHARLLWVFRLMVVSVSCAPTSMAKIVGHHGECRRAFGLRTISPQAGSDWL